MNTILARRFRVLAPDLSGHGASDHRQSYTMAGMIADLGLLVAHFNLPPCLLAGHSLGAHIVSGYAALYPEHCEALALVEGLGIPPLPNRQANREFLRQRRKSTIEALMHGIKASRPLTDLAEAQTRLLKHNPRLAPEHARLIAWNSIKPAGSGYVWRWDPLVQLIWGSTNEAEFEHNWSLVRSPALIVSASLAAEYWRWEMGLDDPEWGIWRAADLQARLSLFQDPTHVSIADSGHMVHYDRPGELAQQLLAFFVLQLQKHSATQR